MTPPVRFVASVLRSPARGRGGFTLFELLVVIGLVAALSFFLLGGLKSGGRSMALQSGQAVLVNLITAARIKAMASGQSARILVHVDPDSPHASLRYLRYLVIQVQSGGVWQPVPVAEAYLPDGIYVVPGNFATIPAGLFVADTPVPWTKSDGSALRSTALRATAVTTETINSAIAEQWVNFTFASAGTTAHSGDLILVLGKIRPPGSYAPGDSPVELEHPEQVRGLTLSVYGVPALVNGRTSF